MIVLTLLSEHLHVSLGQGEDPQALKSLDMSRDIQEIYRMTPHEKQEMMFIATLSKEIRPVCKKFCQDPMEI